MSVQGDKESHVTTFQAIIISTCYPPHAISFHCWYLAWVNESYPRECIHPQKAPASNCGWLH